MQGAGLSLHPWRLVQAPHRACVGMAGQAVHPAVQSPHLHPCLLAGAAELRHSLELAVLSSESLKLLQPIATLTLAQFSPASEAQDRYLATLPP